VFESPPFRDLEVNFHQRAYARQDQALERITVNNVTKVSDSAPVSWLRTLPVKDTWPSHLRTNANSRKLHQFSELVCLALDKIEHLNGQQASSSCNFRGEWTLDHRQPISHNVPSKTRLTWIWNQSGLIQTGNIHNQHQYTADLIIRMSGQQP
jgi:hypothetical protein